MSKIIEPNPGFVRDFKRFCMDEYGSREFSIAEAANLFFQLRYNTTDKWTDPKNITGYVKRQSEEGNFFEFVEERKSASTGKNSKHYRLRI